MSGDEWNFKRWTLPNIQCWLLRNMISKDFFLGHWKGIIRNKDLSPPFSKSIFLPLLHISINHEYINAIFDAKSRKAIIFQSVSTKAASSKGSDSRLHQLSFCLSTFQRGIGRIYLEIFQNIQKSATHDKISFLLEIVTICLFGDLFCCFLSPSGSCSSVHFIFVLFKWVK